MAHGQDVAAQLFVYRTVIPFSPEQYQQVKAILNQLMDLPINEQMAMAAKLCEGDDELLAQVKQMLDADQPDFMASSALDVFALEERPDVPEVIQQYVLAEQLGSGGMGDVYLGHQKAPANRKVAIKLLKPLINQNQLEEECHVMAQLNHPNIATLYEVGQWADDHLFIAMEYIEGEDIVHWCQNKQLSQHQRIRLFLQLCHGIAYAHEKGIIHCDIKPNNVMVTNIHDKPVVKIIDFGIAQGLDNQSESHHVSGTVNYLAPEVLDKDNKPLADTRRDIYAMGVLLQKLLDDCVVSRDLQAIIDKATAKDPSMRYAAVHALVDDIHRFFDQNPVSARKATWVYTSGLFIKRRLGTVLFSLALLITVAGGYWFQRQQAILASEQAHLAKQAQNEAEEMATFLTGLFDVANPEKGRETAVTAEELLDKAKAQLLAIEQPTLSDARFMHTVASILTRMDQFQDAEALIQQSLTVKKRLLPANHEEVISGLSQLGLIHRKTLDYDQAEKTLLATIELAQTQDPVNKEQLAFAHNHLGNVYNQTKQPAKAIQQHLAAIRLREQSGDRQHLADSYNNLGVAYRQQKDWATTAKHMNQALDIYLEVYQDDHPFIAAIQHNLAYVEEQDFNWHAADQKLKQAIQTWQKAYGPTHGNTLTGITNQVKFYQRRHRFAETVPILQTVTDHLAAERALEKQAGLLSFLGKSEAHMGQTELAHESHRQAMALIKGVALQDVRLPAKLHYRYAESLLEMRDYAAAAEQIKHAQHALADLPASHNLHLYLTNLMAQVKRHQGDTASAKSLFQTVLNFNNRENTRNQTEQVTALLGLGQVHHTLFELEEATEFLFRALALNIQVNGDQHKTNGVIYAELGLVFHDLEQAERAGNHLNKALRIQQQALPAKHPDLLATQASLDRVLKSQ